MNEVLYLNALPAALIAVDPALTVRFMNPAAETLLSVSAPQAAGRPLSALPGFDAELCGLCRRALQSGESISLFERELRLPFQHRAVTMHLTPVIGEICAEEVSQLLITIEKADERARLAAHEWKAEAARAAGLMAAMLAHEVKNPLAGIRGAAQLLKEDVAPELQGLAEMICMETDRIRDLLAPVEVFDPAAPEARQPVNIHEALQYALSVAATGFARHVTFRERYDPSLPQVMAQRDKLVQLFLNLIKNAAEALAGREDATITVATRYRGGYRTGAAFLPIMATVEDNGSGIDDAIRPRLFEPLVSSKENGRGLGLAVAAKLAADCGAAIGLDQEFTGGTRFFVLLAAANG